MGIMGKNNKAMNMGRQFEIDLLKAFCIIMMIVCHVFDLLTTACEGDGLLKHTIYYLGNTSAGLFIFCMGIGIVYTTRSTPTSFAKRGIKLLLQGYVLNLFKNSFPLLIIPGFKPSEISVTDAFFLTFSTEILTFAGLTFLLTALLKKLKCKPWVFIAVAVAFQTIVTVFAGAFDESPLPVRYLMGLLIYTGSPIISVYPLFAFFIYVASGMMYGELLKYTANKRGFYLKVAACGAAVCAAASVIYKLFSIDITDYIFGESYHSQILPAAIWYISQAVVWAALFYPVSLIVKGKAQKAGAYLSRNITNIYVIQWPCLIVSMFAIMIMFKSLLPPIAGLPLSVVIFLVTIAISRCWNAVKAKRTKRRVQDSSPVARP